jgi:hypothetical protein
MKFIPTAHRLARAFAPTILVIAISACGGSDTDPLTDYLGQAEVASITVRPSGLLAAGPGSNLIANGRFDAASGPASGWTQKSGWTRFDGSNLIGPILQTRQPPPGMSNAAQVARFCGYPYNKQTILPDRVLNEGVTCSDKLSSEAFLIPAGTTSLSLRVDALGQFQCVGVSWQTIVALFPVADGPKLPAIYIRPETPSFQQNVWQTLSFEIPADKIAQMAGRSYQVVGYGMSGGCKDPEMENSFVMLTGFKLIAD